MTTKFEHKVYTTCKRIPRGKVATYKSIGKVMKSKAYRAIGNALHRNPYAPEVPCHRVVKSNGEVGGFASGTKNKINLLKKEGLKIKNGRVQGLSKALYKIKVKK